MNEINFAHTKINFVRDDILRIQYSPKDNFSNKKSLFVIHKNPSNKSFEMEEGDIIKLYFDEYRVEFDRNRPLFTLIVFKNDEVVYKYKGLFNKGELPTPDKTPEVFPLMDAPRMILPPEGYDPSANFVIEKDVKDLYLCFSNKDYKKLREQYIYLTGENNMPRIKILGLWHSRYHAYSDKEARNVMLKYHAHKFPLDIMVLDTDWRELSAHDGTGYEINTKLFPHLENFMHFAHEHNAEVVCNDHPLPINPKSTIFNPEEITYRKGGIMKLFNLGLDSWWYDRNWMFTLNSPTKRICHETFGNYIYYDMTETFYKSFVLDQEVYTRPVVMSNVTNIANGVYHGIKDSYSHRNPFQWTGDIPSPGSSIGNEVKNLIKCSNNMIAYYSSDIGGHTGNPTKEEYIRWQQFGAFEPIDRPHCTWDVKKSREPWNYDKETEDIVRNYVNIRYRLLNAFYTAMYKHVNSGLGICRSLGLIYPNDKKALTNYTEYMLGDDILVSPMSDNYLNDVKENCYVGKTRMSLYLNKELKGKAAFRRTLKTPCFDLHEEPLEEGFPIYDYSMRLSFKVRFTKDVDLYVLNDDGVRVYLDNKRVVNDWNAHAVTTNFIHKLKKNKIYNIKIEYFQAGGGASLQLQYCDTKARKSKKVYLPGGEWFALNEQRVYQGNRTIDKTYKLEELPLFVKAGALIPQYRYVNNISFMSLKDVIYDYYTSHDVVNKNFFYEDDGVTTGYRLGINRINSYETYYKDGSYFIHLLPSEDHLYDGLRYRNALVKVHVRDAEKAVKVLINGESSKFLRHDRHKNAYPFNKEEYAKDSRTVAFKFRQDIKQDYLIEIALEK